MDREEHPPAGEVAGTACMAEAPMVEPALSDAREAACSDNEGTPSTDLMSPTPQTINTERESAEEVTPAQVIEALLFSSDTPLSAGRLAELSGMGSSKAVRRSVEQLNEKYVAAGLSFRIEEIARGYQMLTRPQYRPWLAKLNKHQAHTRLSAAALETLSIVAYRQPVIRADIEAIRGVGCGEVLNRLREMGLVKILGRAEIVGRPMLYGTTRRFLDVFGLADLEDLPPLESLTLRRCSSLDASDEPQASEAAASATPVAAAGA